MNTKKAKKMRREFRGMYKDAILHFYNDYKPALFPQWFWKWVFFSIFNPKKGIKNR
jgi:hypothetical protein